MNTSELLTKLTRPLAITMWDFSWLERRWPGAGYEDWDRCLDELLERGYDAVRIDAYPHLAAADPTREWEIVPLWNQQAWGSPARVRVRVMPALLEFLTKCADRGVRVGLSSWFQNDSTQQRLAIASPRGHGEVWRATLQQIEQAGLLDTILYVDLCNEWPQEAWASFFRTQHPSGGMDWRLPNSLAWMRQSISYLRESYPHLPLTFSFASMLERHETAGVDVDFLDFLEPHQWMSNATDFYDRVGYRYELHDPKGYENVVANAERLYRNDPVYWQSRFAEKLDMSTEWSLASGKPLITTEGWAIVDYKDWPGLDWGWVKDLNAWAVEYVTAKGRWAALCTSNFCGPQFVGMWRDIAWHQRLTQIIHTARLP